VLQSILSHLKGFVLKTYTHLAIETNEGICLAFLLQLPSSFRHLMVGPKDLHQGYRLPSEVLFLPIQDLYRLFLIR